MKEDKREFERVVRRLEIEFSSGDKTYRGISSDLSERGMFIRTQHGLASGSTLNITIYLPGGRASKVRGIVRKTVKTDMVAVKNGMGIELVETDANYMDFIKTSISPDAFSESPMPQQDESLMITCSVCGVKNKVPKAKLYMGPRCGNCKTGLKIN